jgi:putative transposase
VDLGRSSCRYRRVPRDDEELRGEIRELAGKHRRYGSPRLTVLLRRQGVRANHKRIERIYREEGLQVRLRKRKRTCRSIRLRTIEVPTMPNEKWSMDFVHDWLVPGRRIRCLTIVDDFTRECPHIEVAPSMGGDRVVRVLDYLAFTRGLPAEIVVDNGPEFSSLALDQWAHEKGVHLEFIEPGKPVQNAYIESFNGKFRDECLNENWFKDLPEARRLIEAWRVEYNTFRPHSSLGDLTPEEFAARHEEDGRLTLSVDQ